MCILPRHGPQTFTKKTVAPKSRRASGKEALIAGTSSGVARRTLGGREPAELGDAIGSTVPHRKLERVHATRGGGRKDMLSLLPSEPPPKYNPVPKNRPPLHKCTIDADIGVGHARVANGRRLKLGENPPTIVPCGNIKVT